MAAPIGDRPARPLVAVALVLGAWAGFAVAVGGARRWVGWDEAIYVAQGAGPPDPISWGPQRALGMPWLLTPLTALEAPIGALRLWVLAAAGAVLAVALWSWTRSVGWAAIAGAALALLSWPALLNATELYPNLLTGALLLAALGTAWRWVEEEAWGWAAAAGAALVAAGLLRPTALAWAIAGGAVAVVLDPALRPRWRPLAGLAALSGAAGAIPWIVESWATFGGPVQRLSAARGTVTGYPVGQPLAAFLRRSADQALGSDLTTAGVAVAVIWWAVLVGGAVAGVVLARRRGDAGAGALGIALGAGSAKLAAYLLVPSSAEVRFLLPAILLLSLPAGVAVLACLRHRVLLVPTAVLLLGLAAWHVTMLDDVSSRVRLQRDVSLRLGQVLQADAGGRPCAFESQFAYPAIELASGCEGRRSDRAEQRSAARLLARGAAVVYLVEERPVELDGAVWDRVDDARVPPGWMVLRAGALP